jgi:hypothetical protein
MTQETKIEPTIDDKIAQLFDVLTKQQEAVKAAEKDTKASWKTNCAFLTASINPTNVQTASEAVLVKLHAEMAVVQSFRAKSAEILGCTTTDDWWGYSYDDWTHDFKKRISILNLKAKKDSLAALEKRLDAIVSPEQRRALELSNIMKELES